MRSALGHRLVDRLARVERAGRVLEDHLHLAPVRAQRARGRSASGSPRKRTSPRRGPLEPEDRARQRRLAAARLADERERSRPRARRGRRRRPRARRAVAPPRNCTWRSRTSSSAARVAHVRHRRAGHVHARRARARRRPATARRRCAGTPSIAAGQRGWNGQPDGQRRAGRAGRPAGPTGSCGSAGSPITGNAAASARVYGCAGAAKHLVARPLLDDPPRVHDRDPPARRPRASRGRG